jgi:hypothetical protein
MTYNKPEVVVLASAVSAVKGNDKGSHFYLDNPDTTGVKVLTINAYEADE